MHGTNQLGVACRSCHELLMNRHTGSTHCPFMAGLGNAHDLNCGCCSVCSAVAGDCAKADPVGHPQCEAAVDMQCIIYMTKDITLDL